MNGMRDGTRREVSLHNAQALADKVQARARNSKATRVDRIRYKVEAGVVVRGEVATTNDSEWSGPRLPSPMRYFQYALNAMGHRDFWGVVTIAFAFVAGELVACEVEDNQQGFKLDSDEMLKDLVELCSR